MITIGEFIALFRDRKAGPPKTAEQRLQAKTRPYMPNYNQVLCAIEEAGLEMVQEPQDVRCTHPEPAMWRGADGEWVFARPHPFVGTTYYKRVPGVVRLPSKTVQRLLVLFGVDLEEETRLATIAAKKRARDHAAKRGKASPQNRKRGS